MSARSGKRPASESRGTPLGQRLRIRVGFSSHKGLRENNEDSMFVDRERHLYMVADGMGGQAAGEIASQLAVQIIPGKLPPISSDCDRETTKKQFMDAFVAANESIIARGAADPSAHNLGTTALVLQLGDGCAVLGHIGDSCAYRLRQKKLEKLSKDHSLAYALYEAGTITWEELQNHRYRNVLYKYLGMKDGAGAAAPGGTGVATVEPDIVFLDLAGGDRFLLCSDGVAGTVSDAELTREMSRLIEPQKFVEDVVQLALDNGSKDNATAVAVFVDEV